MARPRPRYLADTVPDRGQIAVWVEQFHRDGFLFLNDVLPPETVAELKSDLDAVATVEHATYRPGIEIRHRMFETSNANLRLFDMEPIATLAEALIDEVTHVISNNSFRSPTKGGGVVAWHQDDPPHYLVTHGEAPRNVRLPVLAFSVNYYLTDVESVECGPTEVIPGSHLFGRRCPEVIDQPPPGCESVACLGPAGSAVLCNSQVWHRGAPNLSERVRYLTQITYARRLVGHKHYPFMNYVMPEHVYKDAGSRLLRFLGFLSRGNYG